MKTIVIAFSALLISACGAVTTTPSDTKSEFMEDYVEAPVNPLLSDMVYCPDGFSFNEYSRLCESDTEAAGPFTRSMILACQEEGHVFCEDLHWDKDVAARMRGTDVCPNGATLDRVSGYCMDESYLYGPFRKDEVEACVEESSGEACHDLRWTKKFDIRSVNSALNSYYSKRANYNKVYNDVMKWYGTTKMGCVAFLSTAMRHSKINIPQKGSINGKAISLNTEGFESYVKGKLKWTSSSTASRLLPGDVVISQDRYAGHPDHVYMFHVWHDKVKSVAYVIDNQGFTHLRNIVGYNGPVNRRPYARHYRAADTNALFELIYAQK